MTALEGHPAESAAARSRMVSTPSAQVAALTAGLAHAGSGDVTTAVLGAGDVDSTLYQLGTMEHLSARSKTLLDQARTDRRAVQQIAAQQTLVSTALQAATESLHPALTAANAAAEPVSQRVKRVSQQQSMALQQLAYLEDSTEQGERDYWNAQRAAAAEDTLDSSGGSSSTPSGPPAHN